MMATPPDPPPAVAPARLVAISGPLAGEILFLTEGGARIGRDPTNDICLPDLALSRAHCTIGTTDGRWRSHTDAARLLGLHPNYLHRLIRVLDMKSILESDR
jgi:hypothetical protein